MCHKLHEASDKGEVKTIPNMADFWSQKAAEPGVEPAPACMEPKDFHWADHAGRKTYNPFYYVGSIHKAYTVPSLNAVATWLGLN